MLEKFRKPAKGTCRFSLLEENQSKNTILIALAKVFDGLMSGWKAPQIINKMMRNIGLHQRKYGRLEVEARHHVLIFCM